MELRICKKCRMVKPEDSFYKSNRSTCKDCVCRISTEARWRRIEEVRAYDRARGNRQSPEYLRNYRKLNPKKYKANVYLNNALRDGRIKSEPCFVCGEKAEAHHPDYDSPLDVVWLCPAHHKQAHAQARKAA